jgi:hypothetical protein
VPAPDPAHHDHGDERARNDRDPHPAIPHA